MSAEFNPLFDADIDRTTTASLKWNKYNGKDVIPLWVADMDFRSAPEILQALRDKVDHGLLGYTYPDDELIDAVMDRFRHLYHMDIEKEWLVWTPGLVTSINIVTRAFAAEGESVVIPYPIYHPFLIAPKISGRNMIGLNWILVNDRWEMDIDQLQKDLTSDARLLMLCNPHNPGGRMLTREELETLESISRQHNLIVCSDEVHCDLVIDPTCEHIPYASISDYARDHSITLMSPSKTFNLAGLGCAFAVIPNNQIRMMFQRTRQGIVGGTDSMLMGYTATKAAYRHGEPWRQSLLEYLRENHALLLKEINAIEGLKMTPLEATYLAWIDVSALKLDDPHGYFEQAGVGLSPGEQFGDNNFLRLNFGCSRALLKEGIRRIKIAVEALHQQ